jgi:hypothetical protein
VEDVAKIKAEFDKLDGKGRRGKMKDLLRQIDGLKGSVRGAYCIVYHKDGTQAVQFMTYADIIRAMLRSPAGSSGPWSTDFGEMARKTVIRNRFKYEPMSVELARAVALDDAAAAGESQEGLFDMDDFEPPIDVEPEVEFDDYTRETICGNDKERLKVLDEFISEFAEERGVSIEEVQRDMARSENLPAVVQTFEKWYAKRAEPKKKTQKETVAKPDADVAAFYAKCKKAGLSREAVDDWFVAKGAPDDEVKAVVISSDLPDDQAFNFWVEAMKKKEKG